MTAIATAGQPDALEAGAGDAGLVREVEDDATVAEEGAEALDGRGVVVDVRRLERQVLARHDLAVLAAQVTDLARLGGRRVAGRVLAADIRVQVREGFRAVARLGDGVDVEVVG